MAEVQNAGSATHAFVKITLFFYNSTGTLLGSDWTYLWGTCLTLTSINMQTETCLRPSEVGFFGVYSSVNPAAATNIQYQIESSFTGLAQPMASIDLIAPFYRSNSGGSVKLDGYLQNNGTAAARFVKIAIALKDSSGAMLDVDFTYAKGSTIEGTDTGLYQGQTGSFTMYTFASYSLFSGNYRHKTSWDDYSVAGGSPVASFTWSPPTPTVSQPVLFTDTSSGSPTGWFWDFGDATTSTAQNPSHTYTSPGTKAVSLTATNANGSNSVTKQLTVIQGGAPPVANFTWSPESPKVGQVVQFTDLSTGSPSSWGWAFRDLGTSVERNPTFAFPNAGEITVNLTVSNAYGSNSVSKTINVTSATAAYSYWVPVASHAAGANESNWRSDLGVLNTTSNTANLELRFYAGGSIITGTVSVPAAAQSILTDVVGQLGFFNGSGALEIRSDQPVKITLRTYNLVAADANCFPNGTLGQDYAACATSQGLSSGQSAWLCQLTESSAYRTNIGLTNTGTATANVTVTLYDGAGGQLASYGASLNPGEWKQENRPFFSKAGQGDMTRGYAKITVNSGAGIIATASVVDNITNDPTTIPMLR